MGLGSDEFLGGMLVFVYLSFRGLGKEVGGIWGSVFFRGGKKFV